MLAAEDIRRGRQAPVALKLLILVEVSSLLPPHGSRDQTEVVRHGTRGLYLLTAL